MGREGMFNSRVSACSQRIRSSPSLTIFFRFYRLRARSRRRDTDWRDQETRRTLVSVLGLTNLTGTLSSSNAEVVSKNLNDDLLDACWVSVASNKGNHSRNRNTFQLLIRRDTGRRQRWCRVTHQPKNSELVEP